MACAENSRFLDLKRRMIHVIFEHILSVLVVGGSCYCKRTIILPAMMPVEFFFLVFSVGGLPTQRFGKGLFVLLGFNVRPDPTYLLVLSAESKRSLG